MNSTVMFRDNTTYPIAGTNETLDLMAILHSLIASVGIISNSTVALVFLNNKKLRGKIPNMFIINQVRHFLLIYQKRKKTRYYICQQGSAITVPILEINLILL